MGPLAILACLFIAAGAAGFAATRGKDLGLSVSVAAAALALALIALFKLPLDNTQKAGAAIGAYASPPGFVDRLATIVGFVPAVVAVFLGLLAGALVGNTTKKKAG